MVEIKIASEKIPVWKIVKDMYPYTTSLDTFYSPYVNSLFKAKYKKGLFTYAINMNWQEIIDKYKSYSNWKEDCIRRGLRSYKQSFEEFAVGILHGLYSYDARLKYGYVKDIKANRIVIEAKEDVFKSTCLNCYFTDNQTHKVAQCYIPKGAKYIFLESEGIYVSNKLYVKDIMTIEGYEALSKGF